MPLSTRSVAATNSSRSTSTARPVSRSTAKKTAPAEVAPAEVVAPAAEPRQKKTAPAKKTAAAATSSGGEPSRIQVLREARKAAAERERGCEALVEAANLRRDPLKELNVLRTFRSNGLDAALEWHRGAALSDEELHFCAALLAANMRAQAKAAGRGSMVKAPALAAPQLGSCASSGRAWRLWAARHSQEEAGPLGAQPVPRVLELAASKAADFFHRL